MHRTRTDLDETPIRYDAWMQIHEGFPGQRMRVLPRPLVRAALTKPGTSHVLVTDCGYFPEARQHGRSRTAGVDQAVVILCARGAGWCETAAGRFPVGAGQAVILPARHPHAYGASEADPWTVWWLHLTGRGLGEFMQSTRMTVEAPVRQLSDPFHAISLVSEIVQRFERDVAPPSLLAASGAAWHLMTLLAADRAPGIDRAERVEAAAEYLRTHVADDLDVAELASMANLSRSHFATMFKDRYGIPVHEYRVGLRMSRARELLDTTETPIAVVATATGYADSFYFARLFKRVHGMTPSQYRNQGKG